MRLKKLLLMPVFGYATAYCQQQPIVFEAASVKVSPMIDRTKRPDFGCKGGPLTSDPGLYTCSHVTLQTLVIEAFELAPYQYPYVPSGDHTSYDLTARVPANATPKQFRTMLQSLLAERFKLIYHFEKKDSEVYDLSIAKDGPKLNQAKPQSQAAHATAREVRDEYGFWNPASDFVGSRMERSAEIARWVGRGVTTREMAITLARHLLRPVTDSTGLDGKYDFTLYCSVESVGMSPVSGAANRPKKVGETEETAPPIFAAVQDKLGF